MRLIVSICIIFSMLYPVMDWPRQESADPGNPAYERMTDIGNMRNFGFVINDGTGGICFLSPSSNGVLSGVKREKDGVTYDIADEGIGPLYFCYEDWIYYKDAETLNFSRINYNTKETQVVLNELCDEAIIKDGLLYCVILPEGSLYRFSLDENQTKENGDLILDADVRNLLLYDNDIYYIHDSTLYRGVEERVEILSDLNTRLLYILDDNFFYINWVDGFLYRGSSSTAPQIVSDDYKPIFMNVKDGKLIFTALDDHAVLRTYIYDPMEDSIKRYSKRGYGKICVGNGKVYEYVLTDTGEGIICLD